MDDSAIEAPKLQVIENADATGENASRKSKRMLSGHVAVSTARRFRPNFDIINSVPFYTVALKLGIGCSKGMPIESILHTSKMH
jgi:hypothetical protein